jgi:tripartite-type tricarboxylate transporter receptor subunit TctC
MKKEMEKILVILGALGFCILLFQSISLAEAKDPDYPTKPITYYIPFGVGGGSDLSSRAIMEAAAKHLGQPFVPINRAGAGGALAATAVLNAKPDGYTLGGAPAGAAFTVPFADSAPYKDLSVFTFILNYGKFIYPLMVRTDAPWKTWKELMGWARKNPRGVKIGITGSKEVAVQGYTLMNIEKRENVEFTYMPFKSSPEVLSATLGGHCTLYAGGVDGATLPYLTEGKVRLLAYMGLRAEKIRGYEDIPSTEELYGISIPKALGVMGPKGIPDYVLNKLGDAFAKAVKDPDFIKVMDQLLIPVVYMNRVEMTKHMEELYQQGAEFKKMLKGERGKEKR